MRPKNTHNGKIIRTTVEFSAELKGRLFELQQRTEATSVSEVLRNAIAVYDIIVRHRADGGKCVLRYKNGEEEVVIFPFHYET